MAYRYTTRFLADASLYVPSETERMEATASLDRLKGLLPAGIDPESQPTLLYVAGDLAVANVSNLNDDSVTLEDAVRIYPSFEMQQVNVEHNRGVIVGVIVKAGLSELGTNRLLTNEEALAAKKPVNVSIVIALWRVVDSNLCDYIEGMSIPGSPDKGKLSFSFEVGFDDYDVVVLPPGASNLALASKIVTPSDKEFNRFDKMLRVNGGKGVFGPDNSRVARILMGNIVPLGAGIVTVPAAAVKGLIAITDGGKEPEGQVGAGLYKYSSTQCTLNETDAASILAFVNAIPDDQLYTDEKDPTLGRETQPHVTALYGITSADHSAVQSCMAGFGPIRLKMGKLSIFSNDSYDVLKADIDSDDLHRAHHLIKTTTATETKWPTYLPHCTMAYLKKGAGNGYVGDSRFEGKELTFSSLTFSPHTGDRVEIPLEAVYSEESMAASIYIKLSEGWQERLAALQTAAGKDPLVNGIKLVLSDGRTLNNVKVFDGQTLQLDKELSMSGVVITDMTPGVGPQADDQANEHPDKADVYPTTTPAEQARDAAEQAKKEAGQRAAYTDATVNGEPLTEDEVVAAAKEAKKPYGDVKYADPGYQKDGKKRYPIDTEEHIRAAWSYINQGKNGSQYTSEQLAHIKSKIVSAWKSTIDKAGPEGAKAALAEAMKHLNTLFTSLAGRVFMTNPTNDTTTSVSHSTIYSPMKLEDLKQSLASVKTVEELPTALANIALFADAISKASEEQVLARKTAEDIAKTTEASLNDVKTQLATLQKNHQELLASQAATAAQEKYNERMASIDEVFELDDEVRPEIVDEVKACATDEAFAKWMTSAKKKMKGFIKKKAKDDGDAEDKKDGGADEDAEDAKAKKAAKAALASAKDAEVDPAIVNNLDLDTKTTFERYKETFASGIRIGGVPLNEITKKK